MAKNPWRMTVDGKPVITLKEHKAAIAAAELRGARRAAQHILDVHLATNDITVAAIRAKINVQA